MNVLMRPDVAVRWQLRQEMDTGPGNITREADRYNKAFDDT
jgi:hypothetical protein